MRSVFLVLLLSFVSVTLCTAGSKVRWPRDAFEWEKIDEAIAEATKEKKDGEKDD